MPDVMQGWAPAVRFNRKAASEYIPTWQVGQEADTGYDFAKYASEGYKNSIIYSCIQERATSLADLPITLLRPTEDGPEPDPTFAALDLFRNPNAEMDGFEFLETLVTHLDTCGNAYVKKVRQSREPLFRETRRALPVKELVLIRPDYITIRPGRNRADDVFEVKVQGQTVERIPRADMVHVRTPNPSNDFYGLSPMAVIAREHDIDKLMTQFDLSFFRNAGVPMGILKTKTRHSVDETQEIKSAFRKAFTGLRKWFDVLVLNSEEAEYQQLGSVPTDMEMTATRNYAESRICAVYGVPPILVGAYVGLERSTYSNYEQAQFSFWSETMPPLAKRIASAFNRELLPEFTTTGDRGAYFAFDLSEVKALQDDNTQRLTSATALIATGGFTVNEALDLAGLPALESGDFYVRNLTQVVDVVLPPQSRQRIDAIEAQPARAVPTQDEVEAGRRVELTKQGDLRTARERLEARFASDLADFLTAQKRRVIGRLPKTQKAIPDDVDPEALLPVIEDEELNEVMVPHNSAGLQTGWELGAAELGLSPDFDPADPNVIKLLENAGANVKGINDATKSDLAKLLQVARAEGMSIQELAKAINELFSFDLSRAETISRTELAQADNLGAAARYEASGLVEEVDIIDGPECGWTSHDDSDKAHGTRRTLEDFKNHVISHPRCVRSRSPVIKE